MPDHDEMVELARRRGKTVFHRVEEVPGRAGMEE
jgi:hypothetical protein